MNLNKINTIIIFFIILLLNTGCSPSECKIDSGLKAFKSGNAVQGIKDIEEGLLSFASNAKFKNSAYRCENGIIYYNSDSHSINIIYPFNTKIEIANAKDYYLMNCDTESQMLAFGNGKHILIYDNDVFTKSIEPVEITDTKQSRNTGFIFDKNNLYYSNGENIYIYNLSDNSNSLLLSQKFESPAANIPFCKSRFIISNDHLIYCNGVAGSYNINIIDLKDKSVKVKDIKASSSKFLLKDDTLYFTVKQNPWTLTSLSLQNPGAKDDLFIIHKLNDMELFSESIIYETNDGLYIADYDKNINRINLNYDFRGCDGYFVLQYEKNFYVINPALFIGKINYLKEEAAGLFN